MNKYSYILYLIIFLTIKTFVLKGQYKRVEQAIMFGNRLKSPVEMDVRQNRDKIVFNVINKSFFPYEFELKFEILQNLSPYILSKKVVLRPGSNRLMTFQIADINEPHNYQYSIRYVMGDPSCKAEYTFPYLIPIGNGRRVKFMIMQKEDEKIYLNNHFKMSYGDSVYAIRKGIITALPDSKIKVDRIIQNSSLEIMHPDGTVAVYIGMDPNNIFLKLGQSAYPGQPIGKIDNTEILILDVFEFKGEGRVKPFDISYVNGNELFSYSHKMSGLIVEYSRAIIEKEMTKRELKKFNKGILYSPK